MPRFRIQIYDLEVFIFKDNVFFFQKDLATSKYITTYEVPDLTSPSGKSFKNNYEPLFYLLKIPDNTSVYDFRTSSTGKIEEQLYCDGCGHTGPDVYHDGYGFNICTVNGCTKYSVRGLSLSDFL